MDNHAYLQRDESRAAALAAAEHPGFGVLLQVTSRSPKTTCYLFANGTVTLCSQPNLPRYETIRRTYFKDKP